MALAAAAAAATDAPQARERQKKRHSIEIDGRTVIKRIRLSNKVPRPCIMMMRYFELPHSLFFSQALTAENIELRSRLAALAPAQPPATTPPTLTTTATEPTSPGTAKGARVKLLSHSHKAMTASALFMSGMSRRQFPHVMAHLVFATCQELHAQGLMKKPPTLDMVARSNVIVNLPVC